MGIPSATLGSSGIASALNGAIAERAMQFATPQQLPGIQHSAYLADALQSIEKSGSQNLRTKGALGSNLLAEAILAFASNKANKNVAAQDASNWNSFSQAQASMLPADQSPPAQVSPPSPASVGPAGGALAAAPPASPLMDAPQAPGGALAPRLSDKDRTALANALWGEARGEPDAGKQAVADVILNRARQSGQPVADIVAAPHQFAGYNPDRTLGPGQQQAMLSAVAPALNGQDITNGADHFYNPSLASPAWGNGPGQMFGAQKFMALNSQPSPQAPLAPRPTQVSTGPAPSLPAPNPGVSPPPPANSAPPGAAPSSQADLTPQPVPIQPQQREHLQQLATLAQTHPQFRQPYMDYLAQLQKQSVTPEELNELQDRNSGQVVIVGKQSGRLYGVRSPAGLIEPAGPKQVSDGQGGFNRVAGTDTVPMTAQQRQQWRISPDDRNAYGMNQATGKPEKVADGTYQTTGAFPQNSVVTTDPQGKPSVVYQGMTPKELGDRLTTIQGSDQYKLADNATNMFQAAVQAAQRPGGVSDVELRDFAARQFSGGVARQFNVGALDKAQGPWLALKQFAPMLVSGQTMSPPARQALLQAMHDDAVQAQHALGSRIASDEAFANSQGYSMKPFVAPLTRDLPALPGVGAIPSGIQGYPSGADQPPATSHGATPEQMSPAQLQSEAARLGLKRGPDGKWR